MKVIFVLTMLLLLTFFSVSFYVHSKENNSFQCGKNKISLCHVASNPNGSKTLCIPTSGSMGGHKGHKHDYLGACRNPSDSEITQNLVDKNNNLLNNNCILSINDQNNINKIMNSLSNPKPKKGIAIDRRRIKVYSFQGTYKEVAINCEVPCRKGANCKLFIPINTLLELKRNLPKLEKQDCIYVTQEVSTQC